MRHILIGLLLLGLVGCTQVQDKQTETQASQDTSTTTEVESKINWYDGSFDDGLALAKAENKHVMLDFYTDW